MAAASNSKARRVDGGGDMEVDDALDASAARRAQENKLDEMEVALKNLTKTTRTNRQYCLEASEDQWLSQLPGLISDYGIGAVSSWCSNTGKHKHHLVHTAAANGYVRALKAMNEFGFDLNVQRVSDKCTPLHLAIFFKQWQAAKDLKALGVDTALENSYGEACDAKYEKLAETMLNIIFLDLELANYSSANPTRILEVAAVVTDKDLNELGRGQWVIGGFSKDDLDNLSGFSQRTYRDADIGGLFPPLDCPGNGLFSEVLASPNTKEQVEQELLSLLRKHCIENACPLAGNSIHCDREVLKSEMPHVYGFLNHRIIDVSSFTGVIQRWLPDEMEEWRQIDSSYNHRALNDVESSIKTMRWVRQRHFQP